jgi:hypothetical protein
MQQSVSLNEIEKRLVTGEMTKQELGRYVKLLEVLDNYKINDILTRGIPLPDGIRARLDVEPAQVGELSANLSRLNNPALRGWRVFPKGIPFPDIFTVEVDIGRPREISSGILAGP